MNHRRYKKRGKKVDAVRHTLNTKQTKIHSQKHYYKTVSTEIFFSVTVENAAQNVGVVPAYMCVFSEAKE